MKFVVTEFELQKGVFLNRKDYTEEDCSPGEKVIGEVELDVKPVKRWVKKELDVVEVNFWTETGQYAKAVPPGARTIKVSYEVEE